MAESGWVERAAKEIVRLNVVTIRAFDEADVVSIIREEYAKDVAASGSVAGLVAEWRERVGNRHTTKHGPEACVSCQDILACADELEAALAKDELRVAAVELAKRLVKQHGVGELADEAWRVLRLAGEK